MPQDRRSSSSCKNGTKGEAWMLKQVQHDEVLVGMFTA
jgi:hypothetical protein